MFFALYAFLLGLTASAAKSKSIQRIPITDAERKAFEKLPVFVSTRPMTCDANAAPPQNAPPEKIGLILFRFFSPNKTGVTAGQRFEITPPVTQSTEQTTAKAIVGL